MYDQTSVTRMASIDNTQPSLWIMNAIDKSEAPIIDDTRVKEELLVSFLICYSS